MRWRITAMVALYLWNAYPQASGPSFLRPTQNSVVSGALSIVARGSAGATISLDGKAIAATSPGPNALTATVTPAAGPHTLTIRDETGTNSISFFARGPNAAAPDGWKDFRVHPPPALSATCQTCHAVKDGQWKFAGVSLASNCHGCHQQASFSKTHTHEPAVLRDCQLCHTPHGSTDTKHLSMPAKAACEQCHPL